jgi:LysM repeat protein
MNSLRPLITITILLVVGVILFVKINKGPVRPVARLVGEGESAAPAGVPPLDAAPRSEMPRPAATNPSRGAPAAANLAPAWPAPAAAAGGNPGTSPPSDASVPTIPDLAGLPNPAAPTGAELAGGAGASPPVDLPANIPRARYPDDPPLESAAAPPASGAAATPSTSAAPPNPPGDSRFPESRYGAAAPAAPPLSVAAGNVTIPGLDGRQPGGSAAADVTPVAPGAPSGPATAAQSSFAAFWPVIRASLDRGDLSHAHQLLTQWYGDPTLTTDETRQVETLLGQLAGTVIYSTEHRLEPPYTVRSGETLETIAQAHDVPWQLLAKINGIAAADQVRPGQQLKVVRGPFSAVVDLRRNQLILMVQGRYAGRFAADPLSGGVIGAAAPESEYVVVEKAAAPAKASAYDLPGQARAGSRYLVLRKADARPDMPTGSLLIGGKEAIDIRPSPSTQTLNYPLAVSPADAEELCDILSIGSRVTIRR